MSTERAEFQVNYSQLTPHNIDCLKLLVQKTFPISYNEGLYQRIVREYSTYTFFGRIPP
jgi:hypothetical protein